MKLRLRVPSKPENSLVREHSGTNSDSDSDSHQQNIKRRKLDEYRNDVIKLERDWKTHHLLRNKKLILVLDLDLTLMESTAIENLSSQEKYLLEEAEVVEQGGGKGTLFAYQDKKFPLLVKLRPFVKQFLKAANDMFEMYIYTNANRIYALRVARLPDPDGDYFASRIITRDERPGCEKKSLDEVVGQENMVLIVDDNRDMWPNHQENLINIHAYRYFSSRSARDDNCMSFAERKIDENETNGMLARILEGLQRVHRQFFHPELEVNLAHGDARLILKMIRLKVLAGCVLFFSTSWFMGYSPEEVPFWIMAKELGAMCSLELGTAVTLMVIVDMETKEANWAEQKKKFLVNPGWIEASYHSCQREPEDNFTVHEALLRYVFLEAIFLLCFPLN
ncbi:hypothetical protein SO802_020596 [Lithocarpus litseifolius]|uniref:RNA polymerase II C-terminal domain phosphatase-like n=1 Tax=Lithocarpus litseifolius TaxID=425828 RepID=A0AAW2CHN7_9ROSI